MKKNLLFANLLLPVFLGFMVLLEKDNAPEKPAVSEQMAFETLLFKDNFKNASPSPAYLQNSAEPCDEDVTRPEIMPAEGFEDLFETGTLEASCNELPDFSNMEDWVIGMDECDPAPEIVLLEFPGTQRSCIPGYPETFTCRWYAEDESGNRSRQLEIILRITDDTAPVISCPDSVTVACGDSLDPEENESLGEATATDECSGIMDISYTDSGSPDRCEGGTIERTWTAIDNCGNESSCVQIITVEPDTTAPNIMLVDEITDLFGDSDTLVIECEEEFPIGDPLKWVKTDDNCDPNPRVEVMETTETGECLEDEYVQLMMCMWQAFDACGNASEKITRFIKVVDNTPPEITCPDDMTTECAEGEFGEPTVTDNCDPEVVVTFEDEEDLDSCGLGTIIRTWIATDCSGNADTCTQTITIEDTTPPELTCPDDITVACTDEVAFGEVSATDNCDEEVSITFEDTMDLDSCGLGKMTRTWIATDCAGNADTCSQTITIEDNTPPMLTCPDDRTVECSDEVAFGEVSATDNCDEEVSITFTDMMDLDSCGLGTMTRTWIATDCAGNADTCSQTITIEDNTPPMLTCPDDRTVECSDEVAFGQVSATDNCDEDVSITFADTMDLDSCGLGTMTRTWIATDCAGNADTCSQTITIEDNTPPMLTCPDDRTVECSDEVAFGEVSATDNCDEEVSITFTDTMDLDSCGLGTMTRTWIATDCAGNADTCSQTITIEDNTPPMLTCSADDMTVECSDEVVFGEVSATDNCDEEVSITIEDTMDLDSCGLGTMTRTWIATDCAGNADTCSQTITIEDNTPPMLTCPDDMTVECSDEVAFGEVSATDNCDEDVSITFEDTMDLDSCGLGTMTRTWTATDCAGNTATCSQTITIEDNTPPMLTCPDDMTVECSDEVAFGEVSATDNCDEDVSITFEDTMDLDSCGLGTMTRTWTATDCAGNTATCSQTITIEDNTPPVITCPPDVTITCEEKIDGGVIGIATVLRPIESRNRRNILIRSRPPQQDTGEATGEDNCGEVTITFVDEYEELDSCGLGTIARTWFAEDCAGNRDTCVQIITIIDDTPPMLTCPDDMTVECSDEVVFGEVSATDNCDEDVSITFADTMDLDSCGLGTMTRTWIATDCAGNADTCSQTITIEDNTPPMLTCPDDTTVECLEDVIFGDVTATDNCDEEVSITIEDTLEVDSCGLGTAIRTWIATDCAGNADTCSQTITIEGPEPVFVACPQDTTIECGDDFMFEEVMPIFDNCGNEVTVREEIRAEVDSCGLGTITRILTFEDCSGNTNTCSQTVTIEDNTPPMLTCPADTTVECADEVVFGEVSATDNCDEDVSITFADTMDLDSCGLGTMTRTWIATDCAGNADTCSQTITIEDNTPPMLTCPDDRTVECSDEVAFGEVSATDNCDEDVSITFADTMDLDSCGLGTMTRTWIATDCAGNADTCSQTITIEDNTPPMLTCPDDRTVECSDEVAFGEVSATDNCDEEVSITFTDTMDLDSCGLGTMTRTWIATDCAGNADTCSQTITIEDNTPPMLTCPDDRTVECSDEVAFGEVSATDNCDEEVSITFADTMDLDSCGLGTMTRTWIATDCAGNADTCSQTITIEDNTPPMLTCPDDRTVECSDEVAFGEVSATDNCDEDVSITFADTMDLDSCGLGTMTRTWIATDCAGNADTCSQTITIEDNTPPMLTCPDDRTVECSDEVAFGEVSATDNCDEDVSITFADTMDLDSCGLGTMTRTWIATDCAGNADTCSQTITIEDNTPPMLTCPDDMTVECSDEVAFGEVSATDNCDEEVSITFADTMDLDSCGLGTMTRTWIATDCAGNADTCSQTITIEDNTPPMLTCPDDRTVECSDEVAFGEVSATDNCDEEVSITFTDVMDLDSCGLGTMTRTWIATDCAGNADTCSQTITIEDNTPPMLTCPDDRTVECTDEVVFGEVSATDNCDEEVSITFADTMDLDSCGLGTMTRTWIATDCAGNADTCSQTITIEDNTPPMLTCPDDATVECTDEVAFGEVSATDNCDEEVSITFEDTMDLDSCGLGTMTRTWTATDCAGNADTCSQTITIEDNTPPMLTCPNDMTVECTDEVAFGEVSATDNCDEEVSITFEDTMDLDSCGLGTMTRTWTATDCAGNADTCSQTITIEDNTPPMLTCPDDMTVECTDEVAFGEVSATDNCDEEVSITFEDTMDLDSCGLGTMTRTWTATDCAGNADTCSQTITIEDNTPPMLTCPDDMTVECTDEVAFGEVSATDNCDEEVSITFEDTMDLDSCGLGTMTRTWIATDCAGNADTCSQTITIEDNTPPMLTCPDDMTVECGDTEFGMATATDNCDEDVTITFEDTMDLDSCGLGTMTRTWIATDCAGNADTCSQTITIEDNTPPMLTCPDDRTVECGDAEFGMATATDNCDEEVSITFEDTMDLDSCGLGTMTRTWTATDCAGNTDTCSQTITIEDNTPPMLTCPDDRTVECTDEVAFGEASATDNCDEEVSITFEDTMDLDNCGLGTMTRTWIATDCAGNADTCSQTITIEDNTPPMIVCPPDTTAECAIVDAGKATATDNCDEDVSITFEDMGEIGECGGTIQRMWIATDCAGNADTCIQNITVIDTIPPMFVDCPRDTMLGCNPDSIPAIKNPIVVDNCGEVTIEATSSISTSEDGCMTVIERKWVATDLCGNQDSCMQRVTYTTDTIAPVFVTCPPDMDLGCNPDLDSIPAPMMPEVTDNCGLDTIIVTDTERMDGCTAFIDRTYTAVDNCGKESSCTQTISYTVDTIAPVIDTLLEDEITVECNYSEEGWNPLAGINLDDVISISDSCSDVRLRMIEELISSGECDEGGVVERWRCTVIATDACGNSSEFVFFVNVVDTTPPTLMGDVEMMVEVSSCDSIPAVPEVKVVDNCGDANLTYHEEVERGECAGEFEINRLWVATDQCGNTDTLKQWVTVVDETAPEIELTGILEGQVDGDMLMVDCNDLDLYLSADLAVVTDDCDGTPGLWFDYESMTVDGCEDNIARMIVLSWMATDDCGNADSVAITLKVVDLTPPVLVGVPEDITCATTLPQPPFVKAVDNCSNSGLAVEMEEEGPFECDNGGQYYERTWTATDACGNTTSQTQRIILNDGTPPTINILDEAFIGLESGGEVTIESDCDAPFGLPRLKIVVIDGCSDEVTFEEDVAMQEVSQEERDSGIISKLTLTITATDDCGNEAIYVVTISLTVDTDCESVPSLQSERMTPIGLRAVLNTDRTVDIDFNVSVEKDGDHYVVERSENGRTFTAIHGIEAANQRNYHFVDMQPLAGRNFYRIKYLSEQKARYSPVREVEVPGLVTELVIYPNPSVDRAAVEVKGFTGKAGTIQVFNTYGQLMYQKRFEVLPDGPMLLDLTQFSSGIHTVTVIADGKQVLTRKLIVDQR